MFLVIIVWEHTVEYFLASELAQALPLNALQFCLRQLPSCWFSRILLLSTQKTFLGSQVGLSFSLMPTVEGHELTPLSNCRLHQVVE